MTRRARLLVFAISATGLACLLVAAYLRLPPFGAAVHPYGDRAVATSLGARQTANVISSVNFDQRALDTMGEEFIFFGSVIGALVLLRPAREERERESEGAAGLTVLDATRLLAVLLLPLTVLIGAYIVAHGHLSPGGGFQGGVILATGFHFAYLGGSYPAVRRLVPTDVVDALEALSAAAFVAVGVAGAIVVGSFLANLWPHGQFRGLSSGGTVALLNVVVGFEVASGVILLLALFFHQDLLIRSPEESGNGP
jgi:multicomponent Na+:H+ antiporter subunit B